MTASPKEVGFRNRALAVFPAGSNGEFGFPPELVPVVERGLGSRVWDTEGREYLDFTMAWGSALVGHAHPKVVEAASRQAKDGMNFAAVNRRSVELAERLQGISPFLENLRFVASGTEATMMCLRVARAATGKSKILKFEGAYHGQHPEGITSMIHGRPSALPNSDPSGAGAPWVERDVLVAPFNDLATTSSTLRDHAGDLAGVIVEPLHRCIAPDPEFLRGLRDLTHTLGIPLIFDEVVTGFRLALGGAREYYGITPDLVAYGKALGGGFPLGMYGGSGALMEVVDEHRLPGPRYAWSASTTGGNPVSCAASLAALDVFSEPGFHARMHELGRRLRQGLAKALSDSGTPGQVLGDGPLGQVAFSGKPVIDQASWLASDRKRSRALMLELVRQGVFLNPMGTKLYLSAAHTPEDIGEFCRRFRSALDATSATS